MKNSFSIFEDSTWFLGWEKAEQMGKADLEAIHHNEACHTAS